MGELSLLLFVAEDHSLVFLKTGFIAFGDQLLLQTLRHVRIFGILRLVCELARILFEILELGSTFAEAPLRESPLGGADGLAAAPTDGERLGFRPLG